MKKVQSRAAQVRKVVNIFRINGFGADTAGQREEEGGLGHTITVSEVSVSIYGDTAKLEPKIWHFFAVVFV